MSMMSGTANVTEVTVEPGETLPEPVPEWDPARVTWGWGWHLHTYGFGAGFFLLAIYAIFAACEFRRRLKVQQYLLGINGVLFVLGASRAFYLFVDPYHSTFHIPSGLCQVLYGITFPCLTSSFSLIQMVFMRITKVRMGPNKLQNYRVLAAIITSHFTIVIVIDVTVAYRNNLKLLLLLCQSIFITWGLVLCFGFVYGGFKMTQFTNETQRVLKQLVTYNRVKQETLKNGNHRELALHRITKPKIRITDEENKTLSYGSDSSAVDSSDTMSFYNEAHLDFDEEAIAKAYRLGNFDRGYRLKESDNDKHKEGEVSSHLNKSESQAEFSSESDYVTDTPSTAGPILEDKVPNTGGAFEEVDLMSQSVCSSTAAMLVDETDSPPAFHNPALDLNQLPETSNSKHSHNNVIANGYITGLDFEDLQQNDITTNHSQAQYQDSHTTLLKDGQQETINMEELPQESGYMADTELNSPVRRKKRTSGRGRHRDPPEEEEEEREEALGGPGSSPVHQPYPLKMADGTVSLYRIRQGRVLHKTLRITYLTTLLGFITAILQLYAMFGVYGVLSRDQRADPWPWLVFHTFCR